MSTVHHVLTLLASLAVAGTILVLVLFFTVALAMTVATGLLLVPPLTRQVAGHLRPRSADRWRADR